MTRWGATGSRHEVPSEIVGGATEGGDVGFMVQHVSKANVDTGEILLVDLIDKTLERPVGALAQRDHRGSEDLELLSDRA